MLEELDSNEENIKERAFKNIELAILDSLKIMPEDNSCENSISG